MSAGEHVRPLHRATWDAADLLARHPPFATDRNKRFLMEFGGNRTLMIAAQQLAAALAGVGGMVFHCVTPEGVRDTHRALDVARDAAFRRPSLVGRVTGAARAPRSVEEAIALLAERRFPWGTSDGN